MVGIKNMKSIRISRKLFTEQELKENLQEAHKNLQVEINEKNYWMAACFSFDLARIYNLLHEKKKSKHYYRTTLEYMNRADFQSLWMRVMCLLALDKSEEALKTVLENPPRNKKELARFYEELGKSEISQQIYAEIAVKQLCNCDKMENFIYPQCLQYISDLWEKAQNTEKAYEYNQKAVKEWEKVQNSIERNLYPIEKAWMYEGIGHIFEKSGKFEKAMKYYEKALKKYELANTEEYRVSSEAHYIDGDWDYYYMRYFYFQLPEVLLLNLTVEDFMTSNLRRVKYRILKLEMQMWEQK